MRVIEEQTTNAAAEQRVVLRTVSWKMYQERELEESLRDQLSRFSDRA